MRPEDMIARSYHDADAVDDLVLLSELTTDAILRTMKTRHSRELIHTYIGDVLVVVNPFKNIAGLYSRELLERYHDTFMHETAPHTFAVAQAAYAAVSRERKNQVIVITGESGAGKTETAKHILQYLATVSGSGSAIKNVQEQIVHSNPVLEAFGNAQTLRNDNSSRFGKYVEVVMDATDSYPVGARIQTFLLEKSRVVTPVKGEQNFHIFYQLIAGLSAGERAELRLKDSAEHYRYLQCDNFTPERDAKEFRETLSALQVCGLSAETQHEIFRVVAAILWLGEIEFTPDTSRTDAASLIVDMKPVETAAALLKVDVATLQASLISRKWQGGQMEKITRHLSEEGARHARDALSKLLYERLFAKIVFELNRAMEIESGSSHGLRSISVLDVFGFEVHDTAPNSLEQLLINYFNERLHKMFIDRTLSLEQEEYRQQKIVWTPLEYFDNGIVCDLIDRRPNSVLAYIDECHLMPQSTDATIVEKLAKHLGDHERFQVVVERFVPSETEFLVKHYAGDVRYTVDGFLEKNADSAWTDLVRVAASSEMPLLKHMFEHDDTSSLKRPPTATVQFKAQVTELVEAMSVCQAHYIRCVKPNHVRSSGRFDEAMVKHQAQYLSLLENVRLRRAGFAFRQLFGDFMHRYRMCSSFTWPTFAGSEAEAVRTVMNAFSSDGFQIGTSKVFIKEPTTLFALEQERTRRLPEIVSRIKAVWKGVLTRRWWARECAARAIQRGWHEHTRAERALRFRSAMKLQRFIRWALLRRWKVNMKAKATSLLAGKKHRRVASVSRWFVGDYLPSLSSGTAFRQLMRVQGESLDELFFFDEVRQLQNGKAKMNERFVLVTSRALYVLEMQPVAKGSAEKELQLFRRWPLNEVSQLSLSGGTDNFVVVIMDVTAEGVKASHDMCFEMERKTEFVAFMMTRFQDSVGRELNVCVGDRIVFGNSLLKRFTLKFHEAPTSAEGNISPGPKPAKLKRAGFRTIQVVAGDAKIAAPYRDTTALTGAVGRVK